MHVHKRFAFVSVLLFAPACDPAVEGVAVPEEATAEVLPPGTPLPGLPVLTIANPGDEVPEDAEPSDRDIEELTLELEECAATQFCAPYVYIGPRDYYGCGSCGTHGQVIAQYYQICNSCGTCSQWYYNSKCFDC